MTRSTATLAVAADYADALMTARRAKNWLFLLLLLILLAQLALVLLVRFNVLHLTDTVAVTSNTPAASASVADVPTSAPAVPAVPAAVASGPSRTTTAGEILRYVIPVTGFLGIVFAVVMAVVLLTTIMLVGRLIGVSHVTSAFIWGVLLALILFPWQAFLISSGTYATTSGSVFPTGVEGVYSSEIPEQPAFKIPGVLYTYPELRQDLQRDWNFRSESRVAVLKWARYVGFPVVALLLLLTVQGKSSRGLKFALGETEVQVEVSTRPGEPLV